MCKSNLNGFRQPDGSFIVSQPKPVPTIAALEAENIALKERVRVLTELLPDVHRMCEIVLGNILGNTELDSLAFYVGHHPDVLNAPTSRKDMLEAESKTSTNESTMMHNYNVCGHCGKKYVGFPVNNPLCGDCLAPLVDDALAGETE